MDMRDAFNAWLVADDTPVLTTKFDAWIAACEWQKQKDMEICSNEEKTMWEMFDEQPSDYHEGRADCASWLMNAILNQGKDNG
jgi:hypothetical protein